MNTKSIYYPLIFSPTFSHRLSKNSILKFFLTSLFISIFFSLTFFIFQVNSLTRDTYILNNYEKRIKQLSEENKNLEIDLSKLNSLSNLNNYFSDQKFEKIGEIKYIKILTTPIAEK